MSSALPGKGLAAVPASKGCPSCQSATGGREAMAAARCGRGAIATKAIGYMCAVLLFMSCVGWQVWSAPWREAYSAPGGPVGQFRAAEEGEPAVPVPLLAAQFCVHDGANRTKEMAKMGGWGLKGMMMVHKGLKITYLQIPKAASSTTRVPLRRSHFKQLYHVSQLGALGGEESISPFFTFTVVREPLARAISAFYTIKDQMGKASDGDVRLQEVPDTPEGYLRYIDSLYDGGVMDRLWVYHHALPQVFFTSLPGGAPRRVDFVIKLESYQHDWLNMLQIAPPSMPGPPAENDTANVHEGEAVLDLNEGGDHDKVTAFEAWLRSEEGERERCRLCRYYRKDYLCLGYADAWPAECGKLSEAIHSTS